MCSTFAVSFKMSNIFRKNYNDGSTSKLLFFLPVKCEMSGESRNYSLFFIHKEKLQNHGKNTRFIDRKQGCGIH